MLSFLGALTHWLIVAVVLALIVLTLRSNRKKRHMAVNLMPVRCPTCDTAAPALRKPASLKQLAWGGWTCRSCGTEIDKWGRRTGA